MMQSVEPLGIDHIVLQTSRPATLRRFYCRLLGCRFEWDRPELGLIHLRAGSALIDLVDSAGPLGGEAAAGFGHNLHHFCLIYSDAGLAVISKRLARHKVDIDSAAVRFGASGWAHSFYIDDPDGNRIELKSSTSSRTREDLE